MRNRETRVGMRALWLALVFSMGLWSVGSSTAYAQDKPPTKPASGFDLVELVRAGGAVGIVILGLSVFMVALIVEHTISIRRGTIMPRGLAEEVHQMIAQRQFKPAEAHCRERTSFLGHVLAAGLSEAGLGYTSIEKSMEDSSAAQSARLFRKIDYLQMIGTLAPMLGLLGTVYGMIMAFAEFKAKSNPQVAELAPGIQQALVTTLLGLGVAVPALASFAVFRNRIDELVAEASQLAEHVFSDYKRTLISQKKSTRRAGNSGASSSADRETSA